MLEKESTLDRNRGALTQRSSSDHQVGNYLNFLNDIVGNKVENKVKANDSGNSDLFLSEECDEKRSLTPQPKLDGLIAKQVKKPALAYRNEGFKHKAIENRTWAGANRSLMLNKSEISCINNKSECVSDNDISQYISREKRKMKNEQLQTENPALEYGDFKGLISSTFDNNEPKSARILEQDNRSRSRTPRAAHKDETFSYKALMELKGSKCTCVHSIYMQPVLDLTTMSAIDGTCGTYCKRLGPKAQKKIILDLMAKDQANPNQEAEPKRYLINQKWWS